MRAIVCLGAMVFLASCDGSKQQLATTQASLTQVTKERDDLRMKVATLQDELNGQKVELAKAKTVEAAPSGAVAAKTETKSSAAQTNGKAAKSKHGHKS